VERPSPPPTPPAEISTAGGGGWVPAKLWIQNRSPAPWRGPPAPGPPMTFLPTPTITSPNFTGNAPSVQLCECKTPLVPSLGSAASTEQRHLVSECHRDASRVAPCVAELGGPARYMAEGQRDLCPRPSAAQLPQLREAAPPLLFLDCSAGKVWWHTAWFRGGESTSLVFRGGSARVRVSRRGGGGGGGSDFGTCPSPSWTRETPRSRLVDHAAGAPCASPVGVRGQLRRRPLHLCGDSAPRSSSTLAGGARLGSRRPAPVPLGLGSEFSCDS